jgi:hypothetical protein
MSRTTHRFRALLEEAESREQLEPADLLERLAPQEYRRSLTRSGR